MTPHQKDAVVCLFVPAPQPPDVMKQTMLTTFDAADGHGLGLQLLEEAERDRDADGVEVALLVALTFGMDDALLPALKRLSRESWHSRHQDISRYLTDVGEGDDVVDELEFLAWAGPEYHDYAGSTALARHAVHGLEKVGTLEARQALTRLRDHPAPDVRSLVERIERRLPLVDAGINRSCREQGTELPMSGRVR